MKQYKTEAVILKTSDIFDADRSLLLFTEGLGKVRARARGVRRTTSKLTGHLLVHLPTSLELIQGSSGLTVTQAQVLPTPDQEAVYPDQPLLFMQQAEIMAEALDRLFIDEDPHPMIYKGLVYTLNRLRQLSKEKKEESLIRLVTAEFLFKCLTELGYQAELGHCIVTGEEVQEEFVGWSSQAGGIVSAAAKNQVPDCLVLSYSRTVVLLRQFLRPQFTAERILAEEGVKVEACRLIYDYLQTQIGQPLRSLQGW